MKQNKNAYNNIVEKWNNARSVIPVDDCIITFSKKLKKNDRILDIGCGTGNPVAKYLSENGFFVTGIDYSEKMIEKALELNLKNVEFLLHDFFDYEPNELYDGVLAFDSFFHFSKVQQTKIYYKVSSWMKVGGYLLFTHGKKDGEIEGDMFGEKFYYSALDTSTVHELLVKSGFEIISSIENYKNGCSERDLVVLAKKLFRVE